MIPIAVLFILSYPPVSDHTTFESIIQKLIFPSVIWSWNNRHLSWLDLGPRSWIRNRCSWNCYRRNRHFLVCLARLGQQKKITLQLSFTSAFRWCCRSRGEKLEKTSFFFAELSQVVRDGGFWIALIVRLSAVPGHGKSSVMLLKA